LWRIENLIKKNFILGLARKSINHYFETKKMLQLKKSEIPFEELREEGSSFVTLKMNGELRGCIGNIIPTGPLYESIIRNAVSAAVGDPRFVPLMKSELELVHIEVSVLTKPVEIEYKNAEELMQKINGKGVILEKNGASATFLPQVWEDIPKKEEFLSHLCIKAGLHANEWKKTILKIETYTATVYKE
jgi:AmmeMemoRadiSam system protein A